MFDLGDLRQMFLSRALFANKFEREFSGGASACVSDYVRAKVEQEVETRQNFDKRNTSLDYYRKLDFVISHQ